VSGLLALGEVAAMLLLSRGRLLLLTGGVGPLPLTVDLVVVLVIMVVRVDVVVVSVLTHR
jgi:hypothetical protein